MEDKQRNNNNRNNYKGNGSNSNDSQGSTKNSRPKRKHEPRQSTGNSQQRQQPQRKRRVTVDRDVEVVVVSNVPHRFFYENPRMNMAIDLEHIGDEEYLTVGDIRTILNSHRKVLEGFSLIITEVLDNRYSLEDVLTFLGLDRKYEEYYSLTGKKMGSPIDVTDIKDFLLNSPFNAFEKTMKSIDEKLRSRVIEASVVMFKSKEFGDFNKMRVIEGYVNDELFDDAQETELDDDVYI